MSRALMYSLKDTSEDVIQAMDFSVMSADEIERLAVVNVTEGSLYTKGNIKSGGLLDQKLGTIDRHVMCSTCNRDCKDCPGHTGVVHLPLPVYHMTYVDVITKVLRMTCFFCNRLCAKPVKKSGQALPIHQRSKNLFSTQLAACRCRKRCVHCSAPIPEYTRDTNSHTFSIAWPPSTEFASKEEEAFAKQTFDVLTVDAILNHISDEDAAHMGFSTDMCHPRNFLLWALLIPAPAIRPSVVISEGSRRKGQDDLTSRLQEIVKASKDLEAQCTKDKWCRQDATRTVRTNASSGSALMWQAWQKLQLSIGMYMNCSMKLKKAQNPGRMSSGPKSVMCKLKGKDGRIRGNLMGKRVNHCARTVITPDPNIDLNEVGVPEAVAQSLTVGERVSVTNIRRLTECVRRGKALGGAATIITDTGSVYELEFCKKRSEICLRHGWVVERYLQNGDYVMFNRQPSLHRSSIMGHRVRIMPGSSFRLNLSCSSPYNADFDGDEMNMHVPQNPMVISEVSNIMNVNHQIMSPKANKPVIGVVQDSLLGAYLLSLKDTFLTRSQITKLLMAVTYRPRYDTKAPWDRRIKIARLPPPAISAPAPLWTGKQALELVVPRLVLGSVRDSEVTSLDSCDLLLRHGCIIRGTLSKDNLGPVSGGLVHRIVFDLGDDAAARFISDIQRLANAFLLDYGFSVGIGDCIAPESCENDMRRNINNALRHVEAIYHEIPSSTSGMHDDLVEATVSGIASKVTMQVGGHIKRIMNYRNAMVAMISAGSKGNPVNLSQVMGCVGQNCVEGGRLKPDETTGRLLSCFDFHDRSLAGRGFVSNSYLLGLRPDEHFFHAMGGREGVVDTAVKTAVTGYLQRRMIKANESKHVTPDQTVRDATDCIMEFVYGSDGMDPIKLQRVDIRHFLVGDQGMWKLCHPDPPASSGGCHAADNSHVRDLEYKALVAARDAVRRARITRCLDEVITQVQLPCDVNGLIQATVDRRQTPRRWTTLTPTRVHEITSTLAEKCMARLPPGATACFVFAIRLHMRSSNIIDNFRFDEAEAEQLTQLVWEKFSGAICIPGEMIGCIAAQSIGEKSTQMTLNTFHLAGVLQTVTMGVPRFKELIDLSKTTKTPTMRLGVVEGTQNLEERIKDLQSNVFGDLVTQMQPVHVSVVMASRWWATFALFSEAPPEVEGRQWTRWTLDTVECVSRGLTPAQIGTSIELGFDNAFDCIWADENSTVWEVYTCYKGQPGSIVHAEEESAHGELSNVCHIEAMLSPHIISGIPGVTSVSVDTAQHVVVDHSSGCVTAPQCPVINTIGSDLRELAKYPWIDWYTSVCNDVIEVCSLLGLEAAVRVLFDEMSRTISHDGGYIDHRHISCIVNTMTCKGYLMPLSRHGINRTDNSVLVRSSFEETGDVMRDAAMFGERDCVKGVSQSIMLGKVAQMGTGYFSVVVDHAQTTTRNHLECDAPTSRLLKTRLRSANTPDRAHDEVESPFLDGAAVRQGHGFSGQQPSAHPVFTGGVDPPFVTTPEVTTQPNPCDEEQSTLEGLDSAYAGYPQMHTDRAIVKGYIPSSPTRSKWKM